MPPILWYGGWVRNYLKRPKVNIRCQAHLELLGSVARVEVVDWTSNASLGSAPFVGVVPNDTIRITNSATVNLGSCVALSDSYVYPPLGLLYVEQFNRLLGGNNLNVLVDQRTPVAGSSVLSVI